MRWRLDSRNRGNMADIGLGPPFSKALLPFHFPISPSRFHSPPRSLAMAADHSCSYSSNPSSIPIPSTSRPSLLVFSGLSYALLFMLCFLPAQQLQKMYEKWSLFSKKTKMSVHSQLILVCLFLLILVDLEMFASVNN